MLLVIILVMQTVLIVIKVNICVDSIQKVNVGANCDNYGNKESNGNSICSSPAKLNIN